MDPSTETEESIAGGENSQRAADSQNCGMINCMFSVIVYACLKETIFWAGYSLAVSMFYALGFRKICINGFKSLKSF